MLARAISQHVKNNLLGGNANLLRGTAIRAFGAGTGREHLRGSGQKIEREDIEHYHEPDLKYVNQGPPQDLVHERGQLWVKGVTLRNPLDIYSISECYDREWLPFFPRQRLRVWPNYALLMKVEYLFAYIPTLIIFGLCMPAFVTVYTNDEAVFTTMVVKVTGRQWYWIYDVESPTDDDDEDDD
eukprot:GEMP01060972.1.p1 GENE.GEMP01060972.1~~GEMP01060972.1.p1  ORF type:complete len:184 (+),score=24.48 GEMP01060972.1:19-570(+)